MNNYKHIIEKEASMIGGLARDFGGHIKKELLTRDNAKKALILGAGAGVTGAGYLAANDEYKGKIKDGVKFIRNGMVSGGINGFLQDGMKAVGAAAGTAYGLKKGKSFGKAVSTNGLAGTAIGDVVGAATIPTTQLYSQHKKEFGTAPDAKSLATVIGANVGPTAAIWGGLYGAKKGIKNRKAISKGFSDGADKLFSSGKQTLDDINGARGYTKDFTRKKGRDMFKNVVSENREDLKNAIGDLRGSNAQLFINSLGENGFENRMADNIKGLAGGAMGIGGAFAPIAFADQLAGIPAAAAAPRNVIDVKKKLIERQSNNESAE